MNVGWTHAVPVVSSAFLASIVEFVEAATIVLAVGVTRGWRNALAGSAAAVAVLVCLVGALGPVVSELPKSVVQVGVGGLVNATVGVLVSAAILTALLVLVLLIRALWFPAIMLSYWTAVLAERAAGTPLGDGLASRRGVDLGLPAATASTAMLLALALLWRETRRTSK